ncbi:hypothetical protein [Sphingomonas sp. 28-63-12]|uniref:hypothetical protein n=1 Tax=Sphingomonas sp. 28-63-12 TaxID=1970434 RepID=UPI000BC607E1|nr:MAG: hypothetical protein B7Y47_06030 [Sphingomonas sp. 28-63-12]
MPEKLLLHTIDSPDTDPNFASLAQFRACIRTDPVAQLRLASIETPDLFIAAVEAEATRCGIMLSADHIRAAVRADPLGLDRFDQTPADVAGWPGLGWRPVALVAAMGEWVIDWAHFAGKPLTEPFYEESLRAARQRPFNRLMRMRTTLAALVDPAVDSAPATLAVPDGLIFHLSRCGSTLVAQMLAAIRGVTILSEPPPLDGIIQLVQANPDLSIDTQVMLVRAMVGALGRPDGSGATGPFIVKLDSWHSRALPLLRLAFPETPWIFLYREPIDILVSQHRIRGMQAVPGILPANIFGIAGATTMPLDAYCAHVLVAICRGILDHPAIGGGLLVNYDALPDAVTSDILPHFGIMTDADDQAAMHSASRRNAKAPRELFNPDTAGKRADATPTLHSAAALVADVYHQLEERRRSAARLADA